MIFESEYRVGIEDVDIDKAFDEVSKKASLITPVPGGVGPMTIACFILLRAELLLNLKTVVIP